MRLLIKWLSGTPPELPAAQTLPAGRQVMRRLAACGFLRRSLRLLMRRNSTPLGGCPLRHFFSEFDTIIYRTTIFVLLVLFFTSECLAIKPQRIVSLKPNITEILFELGAGDRVVGVTTFCDYPEEAAKLPRVADYTRPFIEKIISLSPDLIITSKEESSRRSIEELERMGIKTAILPFKTIEETISSIRKIADLVDEAEKGKMLEEKMRRKAEFLRRKYAAGGKKRVLLVWGRKPLITAGGGTYMDDLLPLVGAENVVPKGSVAYPRWGLEKVIAANPDIIIDMSMGAYDPSEEEKRSAMEFWNHLDTVKAVQNKKIYFLHTKDFRQSPRIFESMEKMGVLIHGE
jgi:iron complex transport system substrate-binding protein